MIVFGLPSSPVNSSVAGNVFVLEGLRSPCIALKLAVSVIGSGVPWKLTVNVNVRRPARVASSASVSIRGVPAFRTTIRVSLRAKSLRPITSYVAARQ